MKKVTLNWSNAKWFVSQEEMDNIATQVTLAHTTVHEKIGAGSDFLGWLDLPINYCKDEFTRIQKAAAKIQSDSDVLLVIGIGGSYLGARAAIEYIKSSFHNQFAAKNKLPEIIFLGTNMSARYLQNVVNSLEGKDFSINVISKSGTTTEPAIAFRIFRELIEKKYGKAEAVKRIYATTDAKKGALRTLADQEGYETFIVPDDIGGRFSVLTAVGLLPIAAAGANIQELMDGAAAARIECAKPYSENDSYKYAALRNIMYRKGKKIEILVNYEPDCHYVSEWYKQLFGESEGKDFRGIFPASVDNSADLHSMGQYIQEGERHLFETVLNVENIAEKILMKKEAIDLDGLNYLEGKTLDEVNHTALKGVILAHTDGQVPNLVLNVPDFSEFSLGYLFYFFEKACAISGYLNAINPFNQPGVEAYKVNMFALLGKKGYETQREALLARLK